MLSDKPGFAVPVHDPLQRLVPPAVPGFLFARPEFPTKVDNLGRFGLVEADHERRLLDGPDRGDVGRVGGEVTVRLRPVIAVDAGKDPDRGRHSISRRGVPVDDGLDRLPQGFGRVVPALLVGERDPVEPVLLDDDKALRGGIVFPRLDGIVRGRSRHAAGVESPLVALHAEFAVLRSPADQFGFEQPLRHQLPELERRRGDTRGDVSRVGL